MHPPLSFSNRVLRFAPVALFSILLSSCGKGTDSDSLPGEKSAPPTPVTTAEVVPRQFSDRVEALGTVRALEAIELSPTVTDRVAEISFDDGDEVKKGEVLLKLEDQEERATLEAANSTLAEQEREIDRLESLVEGGAVSQVRLEEYETRRDIAVRRVEEAQAQIDDRSIRAPFDGVLGFRQVSVGALVSPGDLIATFDVLDPVKLDFTIPETFLGDLAPGLEIDATTEAYSEEVFQGKVVQIDTRVNPVTRSITVRAEIPNPGHRLRPGMLMTTVLEKNVVESLSVPERSLVSVQNNHFLFVVGSEGGDEPIVKRIAVEIGRRVPGYVEILSGIEKGAKVVSDGLIGLTDGAAVEISGSFEKPAAPYQPSDA